MNIIVNPSKLLAERNHEIEEDRVEKQVTKLTENRRDQKPRRS